MQNPIAHPSFKCKPTFIDNIWEYGHSSCHTAFCFLLGKLSFGAVHGNLSRGLDTSNHISLELIHRFSSSVKIKAESLFQGNKYNHILNSRDL